MSPYLAAIPLLLNTLLLWKPQNSISATVVIWLLRIITFSLLFRSFLGPLILRLISSRLRVQSVSLRSIRGIYFRAGNGILQVERLGLSYHRPSADAPNRFAIRVEGLRLEVTKADGKLKKSLSRRKTMRLPKREDLSPFPLAHAAWSLVRNVVVWLYTASEPVVRPIIRTAMVYTLRVLIRALPALTQVLDLEVDSATVTLQSIPGAEFIVRRAKFHTSIAFTQLDNSSSTSVNAPFVQQSRHKRFASVADFGTRVKNSMRRSWERAWGSTQVAASVSINVEEFLCEASRLLLETAGISADKKQAFVSVPKIKFSASVRLDPRQQIERHGLDVSLTSDAVAVDIDVLQHVLKMLKEDRGQTKKGQNRETREIASAAEAADVIQSRPTRISWMSPQSPPLSDGTLSPPLTSPRFGWSQMSPNSPLMEALSGRFRWKRQHPVQKIQGTKPTAHLSALKALDVSFPGFTLTRRVSLSTGCSPETFKLTLESAHFRVGLSHPDRVPLHREWHGRNSAHGDPLTADIYAISFAVREAAMDRIGSGPVADHLRVVSLGHSSITVLVSQWPSHWLHGPSFLSGDPNMQFVTANVSLGRLEVTEHLKVVQQLLRNVKGTKAEKPPSDGPTLPPLLSPVPRVALGFHLHSLAVRLICAGTEDEVAPFALEAHTDGFAASCNTHFRIVPDHMFAKLPADPDRPRLQMDVDMQANLQRTFVSINRSTQGSIDGPHGGDPLISMDAVELSGVGHAFGEMADEVGGGVTVDVPSMFLHSQCACDALSIELWQPDAVAALRSILATSVRPPTPLAQSPAPPPPTYLLSKLPMGLSFSMALGRLMIFITSPDIAPGEDLNISRGIAAHAAISLRYCSLRDKHCDGFSNLLTNTQKRLQLSLHSDLIAMAAGRSTTAGLTQSQEALLQISLRDIALRNAVSNRFGPDDPDGVGDISRNYRDQEYLRIAEASVNIELTGSRPGGLAQAGTQDRCAIAISVSRINGYLHLTHAYNLLLAADAVKSLLPKKQALPRPVSSLPSTLLVTLKCDIDKVKIIWDFPLRMKLYTRISSFSIERPVTGLVVVSWYAILLAVAVDVEQDGKHSRVWEELARLPNWSINVQPDVDPVAISAEGDSIRLRIPFDYVLADLILDMNVTFKSLKHLAKMVPSGEFFNPSTPEAEEAKSMPNLHLRVGSFTVEAADDDFEARLGLIWRAGIEAARLRLERDEAFDVKVATIRASHSDVPSTPARDMQSEFQFTSEHSIPVEEARSRLYQVHSGAWKSRFRQVHARQTRNEEQHVPTSASEILLPDDDEPVDVLPVSPVPPLIRFTFESLSLHLSRPSFASNHLPDFLYREGGGIPRETQYSLLIPLHLTFSVRSLRVVCREYPLPMLNIPAHTKKDIPGLEFDSDIVIAEEMGLENSVEWVDCAIVRPDTGVYGASPLFIAVPKTLNPVKTYANPIIRVKSDDVTDFAWGVSYGPATQDIMRVVDTLSHAPRDSSPPIGFWDKLRLVFHWRLKVFFEHEVHLHMKGSYDPHGLRGQGSGFALCWKGTPQLLINQPNEQHEVLQVVSETLLVVIPNIEQSYGETPSAINRRSGGFDSSKLSRSPQKVCAKFGAGSRFGVGVVLERSCGPDCKRCTGDAFHRECRFFNFRPHYEVMLGTKDHKPIEKTPDDSYNGFRSDFIHLSISLTSSLRKGARDHSSIHLSPSVFSHFWAWWDLFDGTSLPIRQGRRYKHKRPLSPKFGKHLATIKYRIEVPRLFLSHVYVDESRDAWVDGVSPYVGVKALANHFQADMHQRAQETIITAPDGTQKKEVHKPFGAVEVVMKELELRAVLAVFDEPLKQSVPLDPTFLESTYRTRPDIPVVDVDSPWVDMDDFTDVDWIPKDAPRLHLLPALSCPRFTYFRPAANIAGANRVEHTKFGNEHSHVCLLGKEASVPQVQIDIALKRIAELRKLSADGQNPCTPASPLQGSTDTDYMITLLEDYVSYLRRIDAQSRIIPSNGPQSYYMPSDSVSPDEWAEFANVYQVHCPKIYLDNSIRDIMMQYYYCSRARRGIEYHMATRAVKFIRDQALTAMEKLQHDAAAHKERRGTAASATEAAAHAVRKILSRGDGTANTSVEITPEPIFHTMNTKDPLKGWSKGVSLRKGHFCLLLKPQVVLHSETGSESVCILAAVQGKLQTYNIVDDANASDPISGKVMSRNFASVSGLQAFSPSAENTPGMQVVPLEVLIDLRCGSNYFDRLVPQTDASFHYDKFNRLRLRNDVTSALARKSGEDDQLHNHLQSQNDLVRIHVPKFTVSAKDRHFQAISNIVTNLLLFSDAAHKTRVERLERMLFSYDFTNLGSAADVVAKLQARLRLAVETRREADSKLATLGEPGEIEKFKIKAHILLLGEELDYVFEAIKLAQDQAHGQAAQKSALLLHASSSEISWGMFDRHDQLLAKLAVRNIDFRWLNCQDSSTVNRLAVGDLQAFDGAADAEWTEIVSRYDEPANHPMVKRKLFCLADWAVLPPVGGISIYEAFELQLHPMRLQIDTRVGRKIMEYVWPTRRKHREKPTNTPIGDDFQLPPSPFSPATPLAPTTPRSPRRMSEDIVSRSDTIRLAIPTLKKSATSRSFTDLRKAAAESLQVPSLHRTRSQEMLLPISSSTSSGHMSKTTDDTRALTTRRQTTDDAMVMKSRSAQKTFIWVKVSSLHLLLSIMKENSFLCRDARIQTRDLEYRNQTWSFEELVDQFIPSGRNWKGWVKMAFNQPLVPVLPVAREIISKTKWVNTKHQHDLHRRGAETPRSMSFMSRDIAFGKKRQRTLSTTPSPQHEPIYKGENYSSLGLTTVDPDASTSPVEQSPEDGPGRRKGKHRLLNVFKRHRPHSKTRESFDSTDSARTTSTDLSWSPEAEEPPATARPLIVHSNSDSTV